MVALKHGMEMKICEIVELMEGTEEGTMKR